MGVPRNRRRRFRVILTRSIASQGRHRTRTLSPRLPRPPIALSAAQITLNSEIESTNNDVRRTIAIAGRASLGREPRQFARTHKTPLASFHRRPLWWAHFRHCHSRRHLSLRQNRHIHRDARQRPAFRRPNRVALKHPHASLERVSAVFGGCRVSRLPWRGQIRTYGGAGGGVM